MSMGQTNKTKFYRILRSAPLYKEKERHYLKKKFRSCFGHNCVNLVDICGKVCAAVFGGTEERRNRKEGELTVFSHHVINILLMCCSLNVLW